MTGHIHILGICGTFMGGIALLARELGYRVTGSDANVYPPMSTQLKRAGIDLMSGFEPQHLDLNPDCVVVGNAMMRGNPLVEALLDSDIPYTSGPQWLAENVLQGRWVLAVSGTHGKTTTSSLLAWLLEVADMAPGFLIGGVPGNFGVSARLGQSDFFVLEADEYDTAFFDKRSKFIHYRPRTLVINNLEFDHADIFEDLAAIQRQFHHLLRCVPSSGEVVYQAGIDAIDEVLAMGCWTPCTGFHVADELSSSAAKGDHQESVDAQWRAQLTAKDGSSFEIVSPDGSVYAARWEHCGVHNVENAIAAIAAARHVGVCPQLAVRSLARFQGVKRRLELLGEINGVRVYDDFAHHPTAIATTLQGLRARTETGRLIALIEPRSNTMRMGAHVAQLASATAAANIVHWYQPEDVDWSLAEVVANSSAQASCFGDVDAVVGEVAQAARPGDQIVVMSNGGFAGIHDKLLEELAQCANND